MDLELSATQPFDTFLENQKITPPAGDGAPSAANLPDSDNTILSDELKASLGGDELGPASNKRTVTRSSTATAQALEQPPLNKPADDTPTVATDPTGPGPVSSAARYALEAPVSTNGRAATATAMASCAVQNIAKIADALAAVETRVIQLERAHGNFVTETRLRATVRDSRGRTRNGEAVTVPMDQDVPTARSRSPSVAASSVEGYADEDEIFAALDELDNKIAGALTLVEQHTEQLEQLDMEGPVGKLTDVIKRQFDTITKDRNVLFTHIKANAKEQAQVNLMREKADAKAQVELRELKATIARLELSILAAPLPPPPRSRSRSLSRSRPLPRRTHLPSRSPSRDSRRPRLHGPESDGNREALMRQIPNIDTRVTIVLGPVKFGLVEQPLGTFDMIMATAIPNFDLPVPYDVSWQGQYLHVIVRTKPAAWDLMDAWKKHTVDGYKGIKISIAREDHGESASALSRHDANTSASGSGSKKYSHGSARGGYRGGKGGVSNRGDDHGSHNSRQSTTRR
ncbi:hypothetical protein C8R43DRAFT_952753 [Mycena crocata]|nr:hypothetical protein C8R43DRAFT_952753 [Mycena crocata]